MHQALIIKKERIRGVCDTKKNCLHDVTAVVFVTTVGNRGNKYVSDQLAFSDSAIKSVATEQNSPNSPILFTVAFLEYIFTDTTVFFLAWPAIFHYYHWLCWVGSGPLSRESCIISVYSNEPCFWSNGLLLSKWLLIDWWWLFGYKKLTFAEDQPME